jgi:hypothetical protein
MANTNDVYRKIKEMSKRVANPRPLIDVDMLAQELLESREYIAGLLVELKELRLVQYDMASPRFVKLTLLGFTVTR